MKTTLLYLLVCSIFIAFFISCSKEYSYEGNLASAGTLLKDANGNCSPITAGGIYIAGKKLNDSNFIQAQVHVTAKGRYTITTDTINGFSFSTSGSFSDTGDVSVKLQGIGSPAAMGTNMFIVRYNSSSCNATINVTDSLHVAQYTLQGSPNSCISDSLTGSYIKGSLLDTSNKLILTLNVTKPGSYFISTDTVNGYNFSAAGTFASTGNQTVTLLANGTPTNAGTDLFKVSGGSSGCSFSNTVYTAIIITNNNDHFPLTAKSYWNYDDLKNTGDTIARMISDTITENGNIYQIMTENFSYPGNSDQYYFRKSGSDYFEYASVDKYTNAVKYSPSVYADLNFLKEGLNTGDSWYSTQFSAPASFGQVILLQYYYICRNANAAVVVNGKAFTNVYIIEMHPEVSAVSYTPGYTNETYTYYYAKGVGLIYYNLSNGYYTQPEMQIRNWLVN